jgi:pimeloyl-ACP methyl ester carboxylesterase
VTERRIELDGVELRVLLEGEGDGVPVLLLHGFPDSAHLWEHQIAALAAAGHRVIAPDLRGFGESDRPEGVEAYRMRALVGDVVGLLEALDVERAALVGHDWGAALAWATALGVPDRVERLVAISVGHPGTAAYAGLRQRQLSWYMLWFLAPGVADAALPADDWAFYRRWAWDGAAPEDEPYLRRQLEDLSRPGALTAGLNWYRASISPERYVVSEQRAATMPHVRCPTMGVWSDGDFALGEEQMALSGRFVDGPWRYERVEGAGHWVPVQAAERLSALLVDFLG